MLYMRYYITWIGNSPPFFYAVCGGRHIGYIGSFPAVGGSMCLSLSIADSGKACMNELEKAIYNHIQQHKDSQVDDCAICIAYYLGINQSRPF